MNYGFSFCNFFFLLHANIKTAFTDYDNHPETDFYELKKKIRYPILSFNGNQALHQNTIKQVCLCPSVTVAKYYPGTPGKTGYKRSSYTWYP